MDSGGGLQNIQASARTRYTRAKTNTAVAKRAQIHALVDGVIQRPPEGEPADSEQDHGEDADRNAELGFVDALVALGKAAGDEVAEGAGGHAEQASE